MTTNPHLLNTILPSCTPWGAIQHRTDIAPGIVQVSTASHGGIWLAPDRWAKVGQTFPDYRSYAGDQWLEEDCDWSVAALLFPECFTPKDVWHAVKTGSGDWFNTKLMIPQEARAIAAEFHKTISSKWQIDSMGGGYGGSWFAVYHVTTGESRTYAGDPPSGCDGFYSEADLAACTLR